MRTWCGAIMPEDRGWEAHHGVYEVAEGRLACKNQPFQRRKISFSGWQGRFWAVHVNRGNPFSSNEGVEEINPSTVTRNQQ